jgi:hypothetical protein
VFFPLVSFLFHPPFLLLFSQFTAGVGKLCFVGLIQVHTSFSSAPGASVKTLSTMLLFRLFENENL